MDLENRVALVTGASRGVGAATAVALARAGCHVACAARSTDESRGRVAGTLDDTVSLIEETGRRGLALATNLAKDQAVKDMVAAAREHFGRIDILINNAGVVDYGELDIDLDRYDRTLAVNLRAPLIATREVVPIMKAGGAGAVLNISSLAAILSQPGSLAYGIAKAGLERLTVEASRVLKPEAIAVNCLRIDVAVASAGFVANSPTLDHEGWEAPETVAEAILWMLRQPQSYTGHVESLFDLRGRERLTTVLHTLTDLEVPPTQLVTGQDDKASAAAAAWTP